MQLEHRIGTWSRALAGALMWFLSGTAALPDDQGSPKVPSETHPPPFRLATAQWSEPYSGPQGYPKGAQRASLGIDSVSGGETYYARFPAGSRFELHWHSHAEYAVVLRGKITHILGKERYRLEVGDYVVIPPKVAHGWEAGTREDAFLLIRRDGPGDFNFVAPNPHGAVDE